MNKKFSVVLICAVSMAASSALAQDFQFSDRSRAQTLSMGGGLGFTLSPDLFLMGVEGHYFVHQNIAVGPLLQFGVDDNIFLLSPSLNVRGVFDLPAPGFAKRVKPFVQAGAGLSYIDVDRRGDDTSFLINMGFGTDVYLTTNFALETSILFNITPNFDDNFYFAWQFISAQYHF
ncbi:MAG TPA: hypothetical protein VI895_14570 [Bdellovibrionota bacterium]|nr:hypothetical protein [Bdellovibrionota bacterium]